MSKDDLSAHIIMMNTWDPKWDVSALSILMHHFCGGDPEKFQEACRLVELFIKEARK